MASQRSSGGHFVYVCFCCQKFTRGVKPVQEDQSHRRPANEIEIQAPPYGEFEARFLELRYSNKFTKQKNLVRYILTKITQNNYDGIYVDSEKMTVEHIVPENPPKPSGLDDEEVASIDNLILVDQKLNNKLGNKGFSDKRRILKKADSWVDNQIRHASTWDRAEIQARAKALATEAFNDVWKL